MQNIAITGGQAVDDVLSALGEHLGAARDRHDLVVIGGSALLALGLVARATRDVDLLATVGDDGLRSVDPLPGGLTRARDIVARDFGLPADWLNTGPAGLLRFGLPDGFVDRLTVCHYGPCLTVRFASRLDQIHLKLYAAVDDGGPGKHERDLVALAPRPEELVAAARWTRTHDPSSGYRDSLVAALRHFGIDDADLGA